MRAALRRRLLRAAQTDALAVLDDGIWSTRCLHCRSALQVRDDGVGFDLSRLGEAGSTPGLGLITMRERVELAGGRFSLRTRPGEGTEITVDLPCLPLPPEPPEPPR